VSRAPRTDHGHHGHHGHLGQTTTPRSAIGHQRDVRARGRCGGSVERVARELEHRSDVAPPLGVHRSGGGYSVAVAADVAAESVEFCVLDDRGDEQRVSLPHRLGRIWWGTTDLLAPGLRYGFRVDGAGHNAAKLLLDPYARAIEGTVRFEAAGTALTPLDEQDSAPFVPKSVVADEHFDWGDTRRPATPWSDTVLYEVHVKGATMRHPGVPEHLRGTYAGFAHPAFVDHLRGLGVTAVELLPVHHFCSEERLARGGLSNYWGYNSIGFFAPHGPYSASGTRGQQVAEFKGLVRTLHEAGLEVILDVVYNHTAEGDQHGPTLSLRGLSPHGWYREHDVTGCGNTVDATRPDAVRLILDSLRYWVTEMRVDGFRFDLATALSRSTAGFDPQSPLLVAIAQDPVLGDVKLIAEPWDIGPGGYNVGGFPAPWAEWNDRYRDLVRDYWRGAATSLGDVAHRLSGSSDLFGRTGRRSASTSINFVTAHDGFCLRDLVTYETKRNEANGEHNRDGTNDNRSWNCGVEGETDDAAVHALRARVARSLLVTLFVSQGTPMLLGGDELGRTQQGNNNAYCQDNEVSWIDWEHADTELLAFTTRAIAVRRSSRVVVVAGGCPLVRT
jgi:isoamylase